VSLFKIGPLYWELVPPGGYYFQATGAVWFTVKAAIKFDQMSDITVWDAVWPVGLIVLTVIAAAVTAGAAAPAVAVGAGGGAAVAGSTSIAVAASLVGAGLPAGAALFVVAAVPAAATAAVTSAGVKVAIQELTADYAGEGLEDAMTLSKPGIYAGPAIPAQEPSVMRIHGGVRVENLLDDDGVCKTVMMTHTLKLEIPCIDDGNICLAGTSCNDCCNGYEFWTSNVFTTCGTEPCWDDGSICGAGTTCSNCCNTAYNALGTQCGGSCWSDGTICGAGTTCNHCCNTSEYWDSKVFTACGTEPCWGGGTVCGTGTTCENCCGGNLGADCPWYQFGVCTC
jgi:hypothetical protein